MCSSCPRREAMTLLTAKCLSCEQHYTGTTGERDRTVLLQCILHLDIMANWKLGNSEEGFGERRCRYRCELNR